MDNIPHLALPLQVIGSAYTSIQQDTDDELVTNVGVVLSFPLGYRPERPDFGITDPTFEQQPIDPTEIDMAIRNWEPRAHATVTDSPYNPADPGASTLHIHVAPTEA